MMISVIALFVILVSRPDYQINARSDAAFTEAPLSFNASQGSAVTFKCEIRHPNDNNILFWLINNQILTPAIANSRSITLQTDDNVNSTIIIETRLQNNNTKNSSLHCGFPKLVISEKMGLILPLLVCSFIKTIAQQHAFHLVSKNLRTNFIENNCL